MAINAYTGLQGSGKSYEATSMVVVPAVKAGRRVVTNIDGINETAIFAYLEKCGGDPASFGSILHIKNDDVCTPGFFPIDGRPDVPSMVQPGDLVVIDEAWRFWGSGEKMSKEHMEFFRMHRHYTHPQTGISCDVALILQSISDLHRSLRAVVELHSRTTKLKTIGQPTRYRVELFEGGKATKAAKFDSFLRKYDPEVFPLYKSYDGIAGTERPIDARQNVFKNPRVWVIGALMLVMLVGSIWTLVYLYKSRISKPSEAHAFTDKPGAVVPVSPPIQAAPASMEQAAPASALRIAGVVLVRGQPFVALVDQSGRVRLEGSGNFYGYGVLLTGSVDGRRVATWSGPTAQAVSPTVVQFSGVGK